MQKRHFASFEPILDFVHAAQHVHAAAHAAGEVGRDWVKWCWQGRVGEVIEALQRAQSEIEPPENAEVEPEHAWCVLIHNPADLVYSRGGSDTWRSWTPAMIRITLTGDEVTRLEDVFRTSDNPRLRPRAQAVLMAHRNRPHPQIAQDLAVNQRTLQRWLNAYNQGGLDALVPGKAKGATPKLTADLAPVLQQWVIDGPAKQGLDRANWTHEELADHLRKTKGISVKKSAMQAFCQKHEIRPYRPSYRFLRGDPAKQAETQVELAELKKGRPKANSCC